MDDPFFEGKCADMYWEVLEGDDDGSGDEDGDGDERNESSKHKGNTSPPQRRLQNYQTLGTE